MPASHFLAQTQAGQEPNPTDESDKNIFTARFPIDRIRRGPFENAADVNSNPRNVFYDVAFPCHKTIYWSSFRPDSPAHSLSEVTAEHL
jgi:hypothetical protein